MDRHGLYQQTKPINQPIYSFAEERKHAHTKEKTKKRPRDNDRGSSSNEDDGESEESPLDRLMFGVAYNPYLPEEGGLFAEEARRLKVCVCGRGLGWTIWCGLSDKSCVRSSRTPRISTQKKKSHTTTPTGQTRHRRGLLRVAADGRGRHQAA